MENRYNIFNDTPRGDHWIGASPGRTRSQRSTSPSQSEATIRSRLFTPETYNDEKQRNKDAYTTEKKFPTKDLLYNKDTNIDVSKLPLISTEVIEVSKQRSLTVLFFVLIQCYKLYDLILLKSNLPVTGLLFKNSRFNFVTKYIVIDSLFFFILPNFNIPKLTFRKWIVYLQVIIMASITIFLSTEHEFIFISLIIANWRKLYAKELSVTGSSVNHHRLIDSSTHFKGALTIKILPENTAMLNPLHDSFCLPMDTSLMPISSVNVPIRLNSTSEIKLIQLEYRDLYSNMIELRNLTRNDFATIDDPTTLISKDKNLLLSDSDKGTTIRYLNLPLNDIGFYQIKKIIDSKGLSLKIFKSHLIVPHCPIASVSGDTIKDKCVGDSDAIIIELQGVPPMTLEYSKLINDQKSTFTDSNLQPEYFHSPLQGNTKKSVFTNSEISDLQWGRSHPVKIDLKSLIKVQGQYTYKVDKLIDSLGNVMDFSALSEELLTKFEVAYKFYSHGIPKASLRDDFDAKSPTKRSIIIDFENSNDWKNDIPYEAALAFTNSQGKKEVLKNVSTNSLSYKFAAELPGAYHLENVNSNFCPGVVVGKTDVLVTKPIPPTLEVKSSPIIDQCVGQVGLNFALNFNGVPPYYYVAKIYKIDSENKKEKKLYDTKRFTSNGARNQYNFNPTSEGDYEIVFDQLSNNLFREPISLQPSEDYTFRTSMRVKPSASVKLRNQIELCLGDQTDIPIVFKGEAPFTLSYDILETSSNRKTEFKLDNIMSNEYKIKTSSFNVGGDYILSLVSVKDASGCSVGLSEPDARIKVRRDIPSASFNLFENVNEVEIKQGSTAEIPIKLAGEGPFLLSYEHLDFDGNFIGKHETSFPSNYKPVLQVRKEGLYKLTGMKDSSCKGSIQSDDSYFKVTFLGKPSFVVQENNKVSKLSKFTFQKEEVCQDTETVVDLALSGSPPFILKYDILSPSGELFTNKIQVATKYATLKFPNMEPGEYIATIKGLYDANYNEEDMKTTNYLGLDVIVKQYVHALPQVLFNEQGKMYRACSTNTDDIALLEPIGLNFPRGQGPFSLTFSIYHESTSRADQVTLDEVTESNFPFQKLYENLKLGNHQVVLEKVVDSNGCVNDLIGAEGNQVSISITDAPKMHLLEPTAAYCVGDYVTYQLNGVAPFTIRYEFNGVQLRSKEHSSQFVRLASEAGTIMINSLQDSTSLCMVNFTKSGMETEFQKLQLDIHPIPSVTVSQGDYQIEDIHEGDQAEVVFSFEGTPPFSLTYVRTEDKDGNGSKKRSRVVETHKVTDIYDYEYRVATSLQGTYEAIEVSDAFCFAKNDAFFTT